MSHFQKDIWSEMSGNMNSNWQDIESEEHGTSRHRVMAAMEMAYELTIKNEWIVTDSKGHKLTPLCTHDHEKKCSFLVIPLRALDTNIEKYKEVSCFKDQQVKWNLFADGTVKTMCPVRLKPFVKDRILNYLQDYHETLEAKKLVVFDLGSVT